MESWNDNSQWSRSYAKYTKSMSTKLVKTRCSLIVSTTQIIYIPRQLPRLAYSQSSHECFPQLSSSLLSANQVLTQMIAFAL